MPKFLTPPFPVAGAGMLVVEFALACLIVNLFWVTYPDGFAELGAALAVALLGCWMFAYFLGAKVRATQSQVLEQRARVALVIGAVFGVGGLTLGFLGGPHLAGIAVWGVGAQLVVLLLGRVALAI